FKEKLLNLGQVTEKDIELDLANVEYIDSSGVGVLISLLKLQKKKGKVLKIRKASTKVLNVLKLSSLSDVFEL
ncbi:MAG: STAS domain-containing protein, partial [Spirochaetales bacterium]